MTTLHDDLHLVLSWAQTTYPGIPSEVVDTSVYMNYEFATAVVIDVDFQETGKVWSATAMSWDRTGGVSAEQELGAGDLPGVLRRVDQFIHEQLEQQAKLEAMLNETPWDAE